MNDKSPGNQHIGLGALIEANGFSAKGAMEVGVPVHVVVLGAGLVAQGVFRVGGAVESLVDDPLLLEGPERAVKGDPVHLRQTGLELVGGQGFFMLPEQQFEHLQSDRSFAQVAVREDGVGILFHNIIE